MALSPALIMGLVGSLVFFLAEISYAGKYEGKLLYSLGFFVLGAVASARVAVVVDRARAWLYGGLLAFVTFIALRAWVDFPEDSAMAPYKDLINIMLIGVVWWCATKLVWDCTYIDDEREGSGKGLLAAAGWENRPGIRPDVVEDIIEDERKYSPGLQGWYQRYDQWKKSRSKRPHTPGLTVIYFSLAALPIFGLGQALVPVEDAARRNFTFWTAAVYVACALGLLLTTSFLGLRRYLRQRMMRMPVKMTAAWIGLGAVLIVVFVAIGSLLPRPYSETPAWAPARAISKDRNASQYAMNRDGAGKGEGRTGEEATKGDGKATGKGGEPGAKGKSGEAKSGSGDKDGKSGSNNGERSAGKEGEKGNSKSGEEKSSDSGREAKSEQKSSDRNSSSSADRLQNSGAGQALSKVAGVLKWIIFGLLAILVIVFILRNGLKFLANFMPWARNLLAAFDAWWKGLFGARDPKAKVAATESIQGSKPEKSRVPFSAFTSPFADGTGESRSPEELVRYSFQAFEAWAAESEQARRPDETPIEFAERIGQSHPNLSEDGRRLANLVARMVYSPGNLPKSTRDVLAEFWATLNSEPMFAPVTE